MLRKKLLCLTLEDIVTQMGKQRVPGTCHVSQVRVVPRHVAVAVAVAVVQHVVTRRHVAARREVARVRADLENIFTFLRNKNLCN